MTNVHITAEAIRVKYPELSQVILNAYTERCQTMEADDAVLEIYMLAVQDTLYSIQNAGTFHIQEKAVN